MSSNQHIGTVVAGTYRLTRLIGEGGMGTVYEAEHVRLPKKFAVKILHPEALRVPQAFERFRREAEVASSMGHPHIVEVIDFNQLPDGQPYMVMEYLAGEELAVRLERTGAMDLDVAGMIVDQTASALQATHERGVVHRDLKPQNILLTKHEDRDDFVKLLDFGVSKVLDTGTWGTQGGAVVGTPNYMSPEQANGVADQVDHRTDVFALGTIMYEMLTGRVAFDAPRPAAILYQVCHTEPQPVSALRPDLPPEIEQIIMRAMSKQREGRYMNMAELRTDVRMVCGMRPLTQPPIDMGADFVRPPTLSYGAPASANNAVAPMQTTPAPIPGQPAHAAVRGHTEISSVPGVPVETTERTLPPRPSVRTVTTFSASAGENTAISRQDRHRIWAMTTGTVGAAIVAAFAFTKQADRVPVGPDPIPMMAQPLETPVALMTPTSLNNRPMLFEKAVITTPRDAKLQLDWDVIDSSIIGGKAGQQSELRVSAPGYHDKTVSVVFNDNSPLEIELRKFRKNKRRSATKRRKR